MEHEKARRIVLLGALLAIMALPGFGQIVTAVEGETITLSVGSAEGVKEGMVARVFGTITQGSTPREVSLGTVQVTAVKEHESTATLLARDEVPGLQGAPVKGGARVEFLRPLVPEAPQAQPTASAPAVEVRRSEKDGLDYVFIPPGTFLMGAVPGDATADTDEKPQHPVTLSKGFWISRTETTVGAYKKFCKETSKAMPPAVEANPEWQFDLMPMLNLTWDEARAFCAWAGGRLPTEAEWEYAARAGSKTVYYWGDAMDADHAWYSEDAHLQPHPVGQKLPNAFGVYDILGNGWEWCADWFDPNYYARSPIENPAGPPSGEFRVLRGGSFRFNPAWLRISYRMYRQPGFRNPGYGCRCARSTAP